MAEQYQVSIEGRVSEPAVAAVIKQFGMHPYTHEAQNGAHYTGYMLEHASSEQAEAFEQALRDAGIEYGYDFQYGQQVRVWVSIVQELSAEDEAGLWDED